jgi:hypothetical protein
VECVNRGPHVGENDVISKINNRVSAYWSFAPQATTPLLTFLRFVGSANMQARAFSPKADVSVKVVIAYDNLDVARRAEAVYDRLTQRLEETFEFQQRLWRFDVLEEESLRAQAVRDAVDADIVIVAMKDGSEVPEAVRRWLESLLRRNSGATALVALLDRPDAPVQPYLEEVARRGGMDFFAQSGKAPMPFPLPRLDVHPGPFSSLTNN